MIGKVSIYGLFGCLFALTFVADVSGLRCYDMTCKGGFNWWKKKCYATQQPGQREGECDYGRYCLKAVGTTRDGRPISYHKCSFKCEPDIKMSFGLMQLTQHCCNRWNYCNSGHRTITGLSILLIALTTTFVMR
ncbi:uncharacterized protein LOC141908921 [Tubulanus polymorphus]|uniref:uncharacterized protein LOC141908921 n=1 Tax=Tubulanus polymorphus TaxID=672921 RepID=UPI003DA6CC1D